LSELSVSLKSFADFPLISRCSNFRID